MNQLTNDDQKIILAKVTSALLLLQYQNIAHKRLSFDSEQQSNNFLYPNYQGLSKAYHHEYQTVIIKWQYDVDAEMTNSSHLFNEFSTTRQLAPLKNVISYFDASFILYEKINSIIPDDKTANKDKKFSYIVYPYYPTGDLKNFIKVIHEQQDEISVLVIELLTEKLIKGLQAIHKKGFIHGDIKPSNILITNKVESPTQLSQTSKSMNISISPIFIDFSLSQIIVPMTEKIVKKSTVDGTLAYLAPECLKGMQKSIYSDYYALGVLLYELFTGKKPLNTITTNIYEDRQKILADINEQEFVNIIRYKSQKFVDFKRLLNSYPIIAKLFNNDFTNRSL